MKAKKIASVLLAASIALTAAACTVEFKDQDGTADKVVDSLAGETTETEDTKVSEAETKSTLDPATTETTETTVETTADTKDTEETSAETTPETERTVIKEDTCIEFEGSGQVYTLDCKHGNFKVEPVNNNISITMNGKSFELPIAWDGTQVWPYGVVYVQRDGNEYLYVGSSLDTEQGFHHDLNVYKISGNEVTFVDHTNGLSVISQKMEDPACFECSMLDSEENGFDVRGLYEVGPDGIPMLMDDDQWFFDSCDAVSFPEEVSGYVIVNETVTSDTASVSPDEYVRLVGADGITYLDIETKAGVRIRLDWTSIFKSYDCNNYYHYIAQAVIDNIDDRIPCYDF